MSLNLFVTVGTQLPFDRLVNAVDAWCARHPSNDAFAQIGAGRVPMHLPSAAMVRGPEFLTHMLRADVIVAHAGMGTILSALDLGKHVIVMPRLARHGEHRNDHQIATVERLAHLEAISVVADADELAGALERCMQQPLQIAKAQASPARRALISTVRDFVQGAA